MVGGYLSVKDDYIYANAYNIISGTWSAGFQGLSIKQEVIGVVHRRSELTSNDASYRGPRVSSC